MILHSPSQEVFGLPASYLAEVRKNYSVRSPAECASIAAAFDRTSRAPARRSKPRAAPWKASLFGVVIPFDKESQPMPREAAGLSDFTEIVRPSAFRGNDFSRVANWRVMTIGGPWQAWTGAHFRSSSGKVACIS